MENPQIFNQPWAISDPGMDQVMACADNIGTMQAILARNGIQPAETELTQIRDGVAIIEMIGPIFHYKNIMTLIFGFPSAEGMLQDIQAAEENPQVEKIVLHIDSPGGQVGGISELAAYIRDDVEKPIVAYVGDMAASAGYWIASAADKIVATNTAELGSIGVVVSMRNKSDNTIEIVSTSSPDKRPDPSTDQGRGVIQTRVDALADVFIDTVTLNRGVDREGITNLRGGVMIAQKAIEAGLADKIGSLEGLMEKLTQTGDRKMDLEKLKADHAELYEQVLELGRVEARQEIETVKANAKTSGQNFILGLVEAVLGDEAKGRLDQVIEAGLTPEQVKVSKGLFASDQGDGDDSRQQVLDGIKAAAPQPVDTAKKPDGSGEDFETLVEEYQNKHKCKRSHAIRAIAEAKPEVYKAWLDDQQKKGE